MGADVCSWEGWQHLGLKGEQRAMGGAEPPEGSEQGCSSLLRCPEGSSRLLSQPVVIWHVEEVEALLCPSSSNFLYFQLSFLLPQSLVRKCFGAQESQSKSHLRQETARCHGRKAPNINIFSGGWILPGEVISNSPLSLLGTLWVCRWRDGFRAEVESKVVFLKCSESLNHWRQTFSNNSKHLNTWRTCSNIDFWVLLPGSLI